jgi:long-chain acyl-CoA synthetase
MEKSGVDDLIDRVNHDLNVEQRIDDYLIWKGGDFPRTASMNINKREVLEKLQSSHTGQKAKSIEAEEKGQKKDIYDLIEKIKKTRGKKDRDAALQGDLGMDSLDIISLSTEIEKNYGIDSSQLAITADTKIRDIEEGLKNPPGKSVSLPFFNFAFNTIFIGLRTIFQYLIFPFVRIIYRSKVIGKANLKDIAFPTAFISNHVSVMDSLVILYALPLRIRKRLTVVMSIGHHFTEFFTKKGNIVQRIIEGLGFYLFIGLYINVIPLSREFGFDQVFKNIGMAVDRGWNVLIFPEGAVTTDGEIKKFEHGIGIICRDMKIPVVPLRIDGLHNILRNGLLPIGHFPRIPVVKITIGKQEYHREGDYGDIAEKLYNILKEKM